MSNQSSVFSLVKSLSMSEKRYFKVYSKKHILGGLNKYSLLFDLLDRQLIENNQIIADNFSKNGFSPKYISADKNYLYNLILRCLNEYYHEHNLSLTIKNNLQSIEILFHKGLYEESLKLITKTEKLIHKGEKYSLMLDLLEWKRICSGYAFGLDRAQKVNLETGRYLDTIQNARSIIEVYYQTYQELIIHKKFDPQEETTLFGEEVGLSLEEAEQFALSIQSKIFYHLCYAHYYNLHDQFEAEHSRHRRIIEIIKNSPAYQKENTMDCIALYNRLLAQSKYLDSSIFYKDLKALNELDISGSFKPAVVKQRIFIHSNTNELAHLLINKDYSKAHSRAKTIEKEIEDFSYSIEPYYTIHLLYLFAETALCVADYSGGLDYINQIINEYNYTENPKYHLSAQLLNILFHFSLGNFKITEYNCKAILKKHKSDLSGMHLEIALIKTIQKCTKKGLIADREFLNLHFNKLIESTNKLISNHPPLQYLQTFYLRWMERMLKNLK